MTKSIIGWREWLSVPQLNIPAIRAKIDTGAKSSCLHTFFLDVFTDKGCRYARFGVHPIQGKSEIEIECIAPIIDEREVSDSGGHKEKRLFIETEIIVNNITKKIEMNLTNRENMRFRMLLGRTALCKDFIVDPDLSYVSGKSLKNIYEKKDL